MNGILEPSATALRYDLIVIGGGSAGMAAAIAAAEAGLTNILLIERDGHLGGVLPQCIHDGFGLHIYNQSLTGPEYATRWSEQLANNPRITVALNTSVISLSQDLLTIEALGSALGGHVFLTTKAIILATGCRERSAGQMLISGDRPAGVYTAGEAQYMMNVCNLKPGNNAVIFGTGNIGLVLARRLTIEGIKVKLVLGKKSTGLVRNLIQCISDFGIPIKFGHTVISLHGKGRLHGVTIAPLNRNGNPITAQKEYVRTNLLIVATGLIPELDLLGEEPLPPPLPLPSGIFIAGSANARGRAKTANRSHSSGSAYSLVDQVTQDGLRIGRRAAEYVLKQEGRTAFKLKKHTAQMIISTFANTENTWNTGGRFSGVFDDLIAKNTIEPSPCADLKPQFTSPELPTGPGSRAKIKALKNIKHCHLICIACPVACKLTVVGEFIDEKPVNPQALTVFDAKCQRGNDFAQQELQDPHRIFTGTVRVAAQKVGQKGTDSFCPTELLPVKTAAPVPLQKFKRIARICAKTTVTAPISAGDTVIANITKTNTNLIATADIKDRQTANAQSNGQ